MQNNPLSLWQIFYLLETTNKSFSHIRLNGIRERERTQKKNQKCKLTLSSIQMRERIKMRRSFIKNVTVISIIVQWLHLLCTALSQWHKETTPYTLLKINQSNEVNSDTPLKLTNQTTWNSIRKHTPLLMLLKIVTWRNWSRDKLPIKGDSFRGLPSLELVILWSKTLTRANGQARVSLAFEQLVQVRYILG